MNNLIGEVIDNPFKPSPGETPLHFVGRILEEDRIQSSLRVLTREKDGNNKLVKLGPDAPYILIGPRGVGKTTLLTRIGEYASKLNIDSYTLIPKDFNNGFNDLIKALNENNQWRFTKFLSGLKVNVGDLINVKFKTKGGFDNLQRALESTLKKKSILLVCDEAHEYNYTEFANLANLLQVLMATNKYPVAAVFAGTPKLSRVITKIDATFIERYTILKLNRLTPQETKEALQLPFADYDIKLTEDALDILADATDDYPFFIQLVGWHLWNLVSKANISVIDLDKAKEAIENSKSHRNEFYQRRYVELRSSDNYAKLIKIIKFIIDNNNKVDYSDLMDYIELNLKELNYQRLYDELIDLGIIWSIEKDVYPGIPTFFNYILMNQKE